MKKEKVRREKVLDACVWAGVALVVAAWLAFLFFQRGNRFDEAEHTHVAWLISRGQRPLIDFFQHHQPLLWSVLALYFRVGLRGPGVLIWGRILVVLSGLVSVVILLQLGRAPGTSRRHIFGFLGAGAFISLTVMIHALFVIRPETISAPLFLVGLWLWCKAGRPRWEMITVAAAGALAGAACYSSPRFALAGGFFFLIGAQSWWRWLVLCAGGLAFLFTYTVLSGYPLSEVVFNIRYSALLQTIGHDVRGEIQGYWVTIMVLFCAPMVALVLALPAYERLRAALLIAYTVVVFFLSWYIADWFQYAQAYAAFVTAVAVTGAWIGARVEWPLTSKGMFAVAAAGAMVYLATALPAFWVEWPSFDFLATVRYRERLAAMAPRGATVLSFTNDSPITVPDASYYGSPLNDGQDRACKAIREYRARFGTKPHLPPCNFMKALVGKRPYITSSWIFLAMPLAEGKEAFHYLKKHYRAVRSPLGGLMVRVGGKDDLAARLATSSP